MAAPDITARSRGTPQRGAETLTLAMAARLHGHGVVEEAIGVWSVNAAGKEMIAREFAPAIRKHQLLMERRRGH